MCVWFGTHNIFFPVLDAVGFGPGTHDEGIVVRQHRDDVHLLALDLLEVLDVAGQVPYGAARGEGAGHGEEDDFLVRPLLGGVVVLRDAARGYVGGLFGVGDVSGTLRRRIGQLSTASLDLDPKGAATVVYCVTHEKTTSSGNLSPGLRPDIVTDWERSWLGYRV